MAPLSLPLPDIAAHFQLRKDVTFLNHGSFGACPKPVFEVYQNWQREIEQQPVDFFGRKIDRYLTDARNALGAFINADGNDLVYVPNATYGVNAVARSIPLQPGDEVLGTDHEYGAIDRTWRFVCGQQGANYHNQPVVLPLSDPAEIIEQLWAGVTPRTKVISICHITSPTAMIFPVAEICKRARAEGMITVVDGAHAPGQIDLDMQAIGADFYTGNCHKWLCTPKGSAFLYVRPERQAMMKPLVVSWGYESRTPSGSTFQDYYGWTGTADPSAYLSVPAAIKFQEENNWPEVRKACHQLAIEARRRVAEFTGLPDVCPEDSTWWSQMCVIPIPTDPNIQLEKLWEVYKIEVPITSWGDQRFVRISVQAYTTPADIDRLVEALKALILDR